MARQAGGATLEVLAPRYAEDIATADPVLGLNDNSLVVRVSYAGRAVLLPGDIEEEGEEWLLEGGPAPTADVVKVPHHGSATSSSAAFAAAVGARWAVISCGRANRFRFPAREVLARWQRAGTFVLRTDLDGAVQVHLRPDGSYQVTTFEESAGSAFD